MPKKTLDFDAVREIALALPGVVEGTLHGAPSWKVRGKLMVCPAIHSSAEPGTMVVKIAADERDRLIADEPTTFYLTEHYRNQPVVLVRLSRMDRKSLMDLLGMAWRFLNAKLGKPRSPGRNQTGGTAK